MSLESFFHEVALRQASADRDNLKFTPPWWKRWLATLSPTTKRVIAVAVGAALAAAAWWLRPPVSQYLLGNSPHPPGAADILVAVTHHTSPIERARRLVLACARENNALACRESLRLALAVAERRIVASWLKENEVRALRVNAYFEQFAADLEDNPGRLSQRPQVSTVATARPLPSAKHETRPTRTKHSRDILPPALPEHPGSFQTLPAASDRNMHLLGSGTSMKTDSFSAPGTLVDVSIARSANPSDRINEPPVKKRSVNDDPTR